MFKNYKHIIWDWNGTLFDDVELCVDIINRILVKRNLNSLSLNEYRDIFTFPVKDYYAKAGFDFNKYSFEEVGAEWVEQYESRRLESSLHSGAEELLSQISNSGLEQSILSAYSHHTLEEFVEHFGLKKYFSHLSGLNHIYATSKVELGKNLISTIGLSGGEVLLIGDTVHDFEVSREIGADCLLVASGHQSKERLSECGVTVLDSLEDISSF